MSRVPLTIRRWSRAEYDRLVEQDVFDGEPLELIGGNLIVAEPQGSYHAGSVGLAGSVVATALPAGWCARIQLPIALDDESEPEPDIAVVPGVHADYLDAHPTRVALVIEVAESSLRFDRDVKGSVYARGRIADYWIVNLVDRTVEVSRDPVVDPSAPFGWRYATVVSFPRSAVVSPLALPAVRLAVADFLP